MAIFNLGSINVDLVYRVSFPCGWENTYHLFLHAGAGRQGGKPVDCACRRRCKNLPYRRANPADEWLFNEMAHCGVDMTFVQESPAPTGHAIVSVNDEGENQILLYPGANRAIDMKQALAALNEARSADWVLLQNETNGAPEFVEAQRQGG